MVEHREKSEKKLMQDRHNKNTQILLQIHYLGKNCCKNQRIFISKTLDNGMNAFLTSFHL